MGTASADPLSRMSIPFPEPDGVTRGVIKYVQP